MLTFSSSRSSRKKKVALFACSNVCDSSGDTGCTVAPCAAITGVVLSFLMSCSCTQPHLCIDCSVVALYLFQRLVVYEASSIFGNIKLPLLDMLAELPGPSQQLHANDFSRESGAYMLGRPAWGRSQPSSCSSAAAVNKQRRREKCRRDIHARIVRPRPRARCRHSGSERYREGCWM